MKERNYYKKFKEALDLPLLKYFSKLDLEDWIDFFNDYYNHQLTFLLRILDTPKGEDIYSYGLIWVNEVNSDTKYLITKSNEKLLSLFINRKNDELLVEIFKAIRYLKLDINENLLFRVISDKNRKQRTRELAAVTLIAVHENSIMTYWEGLDLKRDLFLIPSYIAFHRKNHPIKGLEKLTIISEKPQNIASFETPILYSLLQISTSITSIEEYKNLQINFPPWVSQYIDELFDDYPELNSLKKNLVTNKSKNPFKVGLNTLKVNWLDIALDVSKNRRFLSFTKTDWQFQIFAEYVESKVDEFLPKLKLTEDEAAFIVLLSFVRNSTELYNRYTDVIVKLETKYKEIINISSILFDIPVRGEKAKDITTPSETIVPEKRIMTFYKRLKAKRKEFQYEAN